MGGSVKDRYCKHINRLIGTSVPITPRKAASKRKSPDTPPAMAAKAPPVALAKEWHGQDPSGMLMSEKLDGMRCFWDGENMFTRNGNVISAPSEMVKSLPPIALDGELFLGRGRFQECMSIVRSSSTNLQKWSQVKYMVFDAPEVAAPAGDRLRTALIALDGNPWAEVLEHVICTDAEHLTRAMDSTIALGGEGIMLKHPTNHYSAGRNDNHLKVKRFHDAEAVVIGHETGKGKNAGRLGALVCIDASGKRFKVGTGLSDADRRNPPLTGTVITYKFQELTNAGLPRFPVFMRVRPTE